MKLIYLLLFNFLLVFACFSQKNINKTLKYNQGQKVVLDLKFGDNIIIKTWDKNEVGFSASVKINNNKLNDALLVSFSEKTDIRISTDYDEEMLEKAECQDCPGDHSSNFRGNIICSEIRYEIHLPKTAEVKVETINANIEIFDHEGPMYAKSISGFIDMTRGTDKGADLSLKTITGECYSDLNISFEGSDRKYSPGGQRIEGKVNGGGTPLNLETISSNIYLRKKSKS